MLFDFAHEDFIMSQRFQVETDEIMLQSSCHFEDMWGHFEVLMYKCVNLCNSTVNAKPASVKKKIGLCNLTIRFAV